MRPRHDIGDFLGFLREHEGARVAVELGRHRADPADCDQPLAVFHGKLGIWDMVDQGERGVAWVPVHEGADANAGFYVAADHAVDVVIDHVGGNVLFDDDHYVAVVPHGRVRRSPR